MIPKALKYILLILVLVAALFAFPLVGFVDPFSLLVRGMTFWGDPMLFRGVNALFTWIGDTGNAEKLQPFIQFVQRHFLPFSSLVYRLAGVSAMLLGIIFLLEFVHRRFWCRYLCPAGAMFGLFARRPSMERLPMSVCKTCGMCATQCRMDAVDLREGFLSKECTLCMDCADFCPNGLVQFRRRRPGPSKRASSSVDLSRREILTGIAAGAAIPGVAWAANLGHEKSAPPYLLRPPGAKDEQTFLNLCIRCGECMKVCPTNVLQPVIFEAGLQGVFSPHLLPRYLFEQSFCEYSCTLCGQVCPTGAIPRLTEEQKHAQPTGKAYFDHHRCLPWAENTPCIRCEEMCPAPEKAIKILNTITIKDKAGLDVEIQQPYVERDLCVGCGICESNCTIEGVSAIRVRRIESPDPGTEFLLKTKPTGVKDSGSQNTSRLPPQS
jgi:ferredoxin